MTFHRAHACIADKLCMHAKPRLYGAALFPAGRRPGAQYHTHACARHAYTYIHIRIYGGNNEDMKKSFMTKRKLRKYGALYFSAWAELRAKKRGKSFERQIRNKYNNVVHIPEGYALEDMMDLDDSVMGGDKPYYVKEVKVTFE